jgi:hypothetical protein
LLVANAVDVNKSIVDEFVILNYKFYLMEAQAVPILLRYGGAEKSIFEMNDEELQKTANSILRRAKEKAFSKGLPIYFGKDGKVYAEYPDGNIVEVITKV